MPGFMSAAGFIENARELRSVIRVVRRDCQRIQAGHCGFDSAQFRFDFGEMAYRRHVSRNTAPRSIE
jgi:hypothetical protein